MQSLPMHSFPHDFLRAIARQYALSSAEEDAFIEFYRCEGDELTAAKPLQISDIELQRRITEVYSKFGIDNQEPISIEPLREFLHQQYQSLGALLLPSLSAISSGVHVDTCRETVKALIQKRCGTVRLPGFEHPIPLEQLYVPVDVRVNRVGRRLEISDLLQAFDEPQDHWFSLGFGQQPRLAACEAVRRYKRLLVLGHPGVGKTTVLNYLATQCCGGMFLGDCVPVFVSLAEFAEDEREPDLKQFIGWMWGQVNDADVNAILQQGKALILMDGLDEVREEERVRVLREVQGLAEEFSEIRLVLACRTATSAHTLQQFIEVEVPGFNEQQQAEAAQKWFQLKQAANSEEFLAKLKSKPRLQELATNPLLFTLLCLVYGETGKVKETQVELYEESMELLLEHWSDPEQGIPESMYRNLSPKRRCDLLSHIAFQTFTEHRYFAHPDVFAQCIADYLQNVSEVNEAVAQPFLAYRTHRTVPYASGAPLLSHSHQVLAAIHAQHGLLVEPVSGFYRFAHRLLHDYFTARQIKEETNAKALQTLAQYVTESRWQNVFLLTASMKRNANDLMLLMREQVNSLLRDDEELQALLQYVQQKQRAIEAPYKPAAVRAFYLALAHAFARDRHHDRTQALEQAHTLALDRALTLDLTLDRALDMANAFALHLDRELDRNRALDCGSALSVAIDITRSLDSAFNQALTLELELDRVLSQLLAIALELNRARARALKLELARNLERAFDRVLELDRARACELALAIATELDQARELALEGDRTLALALDSALARDRDLARELALARALDQDRDRALSLDRNRALARDHTRDLDRERPLALELDRARDLKQALQMLTLQLPDPQGDRTAFEQWWSANGKAWIEQLRSVLIEHRNIGHDWQFSPEQMERLKQYYNANKLLVDCLNSECYVTQDVRESIEASLVLPETELQSDQR